MVLGNCFFTSALALAAPAIVVAGPLQERQAETVTKTAYAHPMSLTPLATAPPTQTPLTYPSPPTPIPYPTSSSSSAVSPPPTVAKVPNNNDDDDDDDNANAVAPTCTTIQGSYPQVTLPALCHPSLHTNAPSLATQPALPPHATATVSAVSNKLECCARCSSYVYNCFAWRFLPVFASDPTPDLPGGFDPWGRGDCEVLYHIGNNNNNNADDDENENDAEPDICPNGVVGDVLAGSNNDDPAAKVWRNVYFNGWNQGACGAPVEAFAPGREVPGTGVAEGDLC